MKRKRLSGSKIRWGRASLVLALVLALAMLGAVVLVPALRAGVRERAGGWLVESETATPYVVALRSGAPLVWGGLSWSLEGPAPASRSSRSPTPAATRTTAPQAPAPQGTAPGTARPAQATRPPAPHCPNEGVQLTTPGMGAVVKGKVEVRGTANIEGFQYYKLELGWGKAPSSWQVIGELHTAPVEKGLLGVWDGAAVEAGVYQLRLVVVVDRTGNYPAPCRTWVRVTHQGN